MHKIDLVVNKLKEQDVHLEREVVQKVIRAYNNIKGKSANPYNYEVKDKPEILEIFEKCSVRTQNNIRRFITSKGFDPRDPEELAEQIPLIQDSEYISLSGIGSNSLVEFTELKKAISK